MGKGSNTTSTQQQQSYQPAGGSQIQGALTQAQNAAQLPFNIPQAPVAGFSPQQQQAFGLVGQAQGQAQPYYNQASQLFNQSAQAPDVSQFFNPMASAVTAQMNNIFGQQQSQNTGQLTQAAGGVGADRIAVGQGNLANQQGLAAGQTLAGLYQPALAAAQQQQSLQQGAAYGQAAVGSQAQNAALSGANALLGTGGLQQQLSQAQLNAPYQQQLAQAAFPYQQASFLSGITGALAPGLGGTTSGQGTSTGPSPSMLSQILGLGTAAAGAAGGAGMFNPTSGTNPKGSSPSYGGGNMFSGDAYGGSGSNPLPGLSAGDYGAAGGRVAAYAPGGAVDEDEGGANPYQLPPGFNDKPINVAAQSIIPQVQQSAIKPTMPNLNLNPPSPGANTSGSDTAKAVGDVAKLAMMFVKRGGRVLPRFAEGGTPSPLDDAQWPYGPEGGPSPLDHAQWPSGPVGGPSDVVNPDEPYRMPGQAAVDDWRSGADATMALSGNADATKAFPPPPGSHGRSGNASAPAAAPDAAQEVSAPSAGSAAAPEGKEGRFIDSPWAALMAAGLGIAGGTSPFPMVNIGQGGMQGLKTLESQKASSQKDETIAQAARRLDLEAKHHEDQYTRMTPAQKEEIGLRKSQMGLNENKPVKIGTDALGHDILAIRDKDTGQYVDPITRKPIQDPNARRPTYNIPPGGKEDEAALPPHAQLTEGIDIPQGVDRNVLAQLPPSVANTVRGIDEGRTNLSSIPMKERAALLKLVNEYDPAWDQNLYSLRKKQNDDLSTNGNAGKMIMAVNQLLPHLKKASDDAEALNNTGYPAANTIKNWWLTQTGDPRVKKFEQVREVAAMDAARLLRGSGQMAEKDIDFWRQNFSAADSPKTLQGLIDQLADDLMGARISSIQQSYRMNMRKEAPDFVSKEAKDALAGIKARAAPAPASGAATPAAAAPATPAAPPQVGETRTNAHGVKGRWNGTGWEVVQ